MTVVSKSPLRKRKGAVQSRTLIGWREWVELPDLGVDRVNAKIDTGAQSSAIHAFRIKEIDIDGEAHASFFLHPLQRRKKPEIACCEPVIGRKIIRSSNGEEQERPVIRTCIHMGEAYWEIDLTLANRGAMGFRMLIGRDALQGRFTIDPGASHLLGR